MKNNSRLIFAFLAVAFVFSFICSPASFAQSRPQRPDPTKQGGGKANPRPTPKTEEELKKEEERRKQEEEDRSAIVDDEVINLDTNIINVDAVVYNKKSGQIITGLKKDNFAIFENGVKQEVTNFATPEAPITVSLVLEYSKWSELFGYANGPFESGKMEVVRPVAYFLSRFIKAPDDYASVIAFDMRPTTITDFTNDPARINQTIELLLRNNPAFRENNLFDSMKFALVGGKGDAVVLENTKEKSVEFSGLASVKAKRRAIILVASGINTFSKTNYDEVRKIIQATGIPIYIISTGNLFYKKYEHRLGAADDITGGPGRMTFLQAKNTMNTFAKESGGMHYEMTFEGELPGYLQSINALLRNQYSLAYDAGETAREPGKKYKLEVKVDIDGDGIYEDKQFVVQHRPFYTTPKQEKPKSKK